MNRKISIKDALKSRLSFYIFKGEELYLKNEIEDFFKEKEISIVYLDGNELDTANIKELVTKLSIKYAQQRVFVISNFESVSVQVQNMLLKIIEDLGEHKTLIALCKKSDGILDTIISRAYYLYIPNSEIETSVGFVLPEEKDILSDYKLLSAALNEEALSFIEGLDLEYNSNKTVVNHTLEYFNRINANCNGELCLDLLIYKVLEDKWIQKL